MQHSAYTNIRVIGSAGIVHRECRSLFLGTDFLLFLSNWKQTQIHDQRALLSACRRYLALVPWPLLLSTLNRKNCSKFQAATRQWMFLATQVLCCKVPEFSQLRKACSWLVCLITEDILCSPHLSCKIMEKKHMRTWESVLSYLCHWPDHFAWIEITIGMLSIIFYPFLVFTL